MTRKDADALIHEARELVEGEYDSNPEYGRALVELIYWGTPHGRSREEIEKLIRRNPNMRRG